jgi:hypothetical protein
MARRPASRTRRPHLTTPPPPSAPVEVRNVLDGVAASLLPTIRSLAPDLRAVTVISPGRVEITLR